MVDRNGCSTAGNWLKIKPTTHLYAEAQNLKSGTRDLALERIKAAKEFTTCIRHCAYIYT